MRSWLASLAVVMALTALPAGSHATPCTSRCRHVARNCKYRCKMTFAHRPARRDCLEKCKAREYNCRARCP